MITRHSRFFFLAPPGHAALVRGENKPPVAVDIPAGRCAFGRAEADDYPHFDIGLSSAAVNEPFLRRLEPIGRKHRQRVWLDANTVERNQQPLADQLCEFRSDLSNELAMNSTELELRNNIGMEICYHNDSSDIIWTILHILFELSEVEVPLRTFVLLPLVNVDVDNKPRIGRHRFDFENDGRA